MRDRLYLIHMDTLQNAIRRMTEELGEALSREGFEVCLLDPLDPEAIRACSLDFSANRLAGIVSINIYANFLGPFAEAFNAAGVKVFFYGTDHPYHGYEAYQYFSRNITNLAISLTSDTWAALAGRLFSRPEVFRWLPQGAALLPQVPLEGRDIGHLLAANNILVTMGWPADPALFRATWPALFGLDAARKLNAMVEVYQARPATDLADIVQEVLSADLRHYDLPAHRDFAMRLDVFLRSLVRAEAIQALMAVPAVICGRGWDYLVQGRSRAVFLGSVDSGGVQDLARRAKVVYNAVPVYCQCSERVLEAVSFGTPVTTSASRFFRDQFGDTLRYFNTPGELAEIIATPESDEVLADRVARARARFAGRHDWDARAREIAAFMRAPPVLKSP